MSEKGLTKVTINLILHLVVLGVGFELVLCAIRKCALLARATHALQAAVDTFVAGGGIPGCFASGVALFALLAVGFHAEAVLVDVCHERYALHFVVAILFA
jgi:hypothetical protein